MSNPLDLLQGTLDMLILKAISLGPLHGYGVLLRIEQISGKQLEVQRCIVSNIRAGSPASGANRRASAKPSFTGSRPPGSGACRWKRINGTAWPT